MKEQLEIENILKELSRNHSPGKWKPEDYIGSGVSKFVFLNLKIPQVRKIRDRGYSFANKPIEVQWRIWNDIWHSTNVFEAAISAAHFVSSRPIEELIIHRSLLVKWQRRVDNWALSDELSSFYSRILENDRKNMLPTLEKWNNSNNPWNKRQSMVALLFYSRFRKKYLSCKKILSFIKPHLDDDHYYVQKGVGWALRECWNLYPERTFEFLVENAYRIPSAGWTAATEKLSPKEKILLKSHRGKLR